MEEGVEKQRRPIGADRDARGRENDNASNRPLRKDIALTDGWLRGFAMWVAANSTTPATVPCRAPRERTLPHADHVDAAKCRGGMGEGAPLNCSGSGCEGFGFRIGTGSPATDALSWKVALILAPGALSLTRDGYQQSEAQ